MIVHYLRTALRFLKQNKLYTAINALGLSVSLAVSFIILLFVINELSYDHCHKNRKRIYRVVSYLKEFKYVQAGTPYVLARTLKEEFPEVEKSTTTRYLRDFKIKQDENSIDIYEALATDSQIFDIFSIPMARSSLHDEELRDLNSIVLSEKLAKQLFQDEEAVGKELDVIINNTDQVFLVTGVFRDLPRNVSLKANCMVNIQWTLDPLNKVFRTDDMDRTWQYNFWRTWILLSEKADESSWENKFLNLETKHISDDPYIHFSLQKLSDVYLRSQDIANSSQAGNLKNIRLFSGIALLIVLIAAINYIILSFAVSTKRAKEIGIRKAAGASIRNIRNQVQSEAVILTLLVLPLAVVFMWIGKPYGQKLFQTSLELIPGNIAAYVLAYLFLTILIGLASGLYASSFLSRLKVVDVLKQKVSIGKKRKVFRSALIVVQLMIFCSLISGTLIIHKQYSFALNMDPGYSKKDILQVNLGRNFKHYQAFLSAVHSLPEVTNAAGAMDGLPMGGWMVTMHSHFQDKEKKVKMEGFTVDFDLIETLGMEMVEGRSFSREYGSDHRSVILNETAVRELGIEDPIGKRMDSIHEIIGVVKDFNLHTIHSGIPPLSLGMTKEYKYLDHIFIHYKPGMLSELMPKLKTEWKKFEPDKPLYSSSLEWALKSRYMAEKNLSIIFSVAAIFGMLIATLGLFGLTLFVARSRTNEIGIRKVFGCPERNIVNSFLKSNFILVVLAQLLSIPITIFYLNRWLSNFSDRTAIEWWIFVLVFIAAAFIVLVTVYIHSWKISRVNPVEALRYE